MSESKCILCVGTPGKTYDKVNRSNLWQKLSEQGVDDLIVNVLKEFYIGSKV